MNILFIIVAIIVAGGSVISGISSNIGKKINQIPSAIPVLTKQPTPTPVYQNIQKSNTTVAPTISSADWDKIKKKLQEQLKNVKFPTSAPVVIPTINLPSPTKPLQFGCSPEGQQKINEYNTQIKQEYDTCAADANAKVQDVFKICGSDNDCILKISQGPNNCTLSYQEKTKYVMTLMSQYCGLR